MKLTEQEQERVIAHFNLDLHEIEQYEVIDYIKEIRVVSK